MQKLSRTTTFALLVFLTWLALPVHSQDTLSAQVLRLLDRVNTWSAAQTFDAGITVTSCVGCGMSSGSAPDSAQYWTGAPNATLTAEKDLSALATGLVINTTGTPSAYGGSTCSNGQLATSVSASGVLTCGGWSEVVAALDQDIDTQTTPQNDSELMFDMVAAALYEFDYMLAYSSPAGGGTPDFKYTFNGPATLTGTYAGFHALSTADAQGGYAAVNLAATNALGTAATPRITRGVGWAYSTAGGTGTSGFILQWSQNTSGGNPTRRLAGSVLRYRRLL